jgi:inner membrane protein
MATFITHPLFGAGAAYVISQPQPLSRRFMILSIFCQWVPDIDTFAYLFAVSDSHPLGHRGIAHSVLFALVLSLVIVRLFYRQFTLSHRQYWGLHLWFFLVTLSHGLLDALVDSKLGVAFFWPFDTQRYVFAWRPLLDVPIDISMIVNQRFWSAQLVEFQFISFLLAILFILKQYVRGPAHRLSAPTPIKSLVADS